MREQPFVRGAMAIAAGAALGAHWLRSTPVEDSLLGEFSDAAKARMKAKPTRAPANCALRRRAHSGRHGKSPAPAKAKRTDVGDGVAKEEPPSRGRHRSRARGTLSLTDTSPSGSRCLGHGRARPLSLALCAMAEFRSLHGEGRNAWY